MTAVVILAAGASSRLGTPKQNLLFKGKTLLQLAVNNALQVSENISVVLGAYADNIEHTVSKQPVTILHNPQWQEGMASSIHLAISSLAPQVDSVILMLCDQPYADAALLNKMINESKVTAKGIVACAYNDTRGVPVLFNRAYFPLLLTLTGEEGAKQILKQHAEDVFEVDFPLGAVDIDTVGDYEGLAL